MQPQAVFGLIVFLLIASIGTLMSIASVFKPLNVTGMLKKSIGYDLMQHAQHEGFMEAMRKLGLYQGSILLGANFFTLFVAVLAFRDQVELAWWALWYWPIMFTWHFLIYAKRTPMWYMQLGWLTISIVALLLNY